MTVVPIPTFVPQDSWYALTTGNVNPSVLDTVPDISYLRPSTTALGDIDGLVGPFDGAIIGLAGTDSTLDGGQRLLMWKANSLFPDNGSSVFCPFVSPTTAGRWISLSIPVPRANVDVVDTQTIVAGTEATVTTSESPFIQVFVRARVVNAVTTVHLPAPSSTFVGQRVSVKDAQGDAATYNISVVAPSIDGATSFVFYANYQEQSFTWNGATYSAI